MKALPKILLALTAVAMLSVGYPASVQAVPTTYQYTGNPFTTVTAPYTTSDFVSGMLTLAGPLAPNLPLTDVTPTAFTFSDGVQTMTNLNAAGFLFQFATDGSGDITQWIIRVIGLSGAEIQTNEPIGGFAFDEGTTELGAGMGANAGTPGTWSTVAGVADTGSTLSLMTLTLTALGVAAWRFKRGGQRPDARHLRVVVGDWITEPERLSSAGRACLMAARQFLCSVALYSAWLPCGAK
jgi:hypothetical protein